MVLLPQTESPPAATEKKSIFKNRFKQVFAKVHFAAPKRKQSWKPQQPEIVRRCCKYGCLRRKPPGDDALESPASRDEIPAPLQSDDLLLGGIFNTLAEEDENMRTSSSLEEDDLSLMDVNLADSLDSYKKEENQTALNSRTGLSPPEAVPVYQNGNDVTIAVASLTSKDKAETTQSAKGFKSQMKDVVRSIRRGLKRESRGDQPPLVTSPELEVQACNDRKRAEELERFKGQEAEKCTVVYPFDSPRDKQATLRKTEEPIHTADKETDDVASEYESLLGGGPDGKAHKHEKQEGDALQAEHALKAVEREEADREAREEVEAKAPLPSIDTGEPVQEVERETCQHRGGMKSLANFCSTSCAHAKSALKKTWKCITIPILAIRRKFFKPTPPEEQYLIEVQLEEERERNAEAAKQQLRQHDQEVWNSVTRPQLKALYATIEATVAKNPKEKLIWLRALYRTLLHKTSRQDPEDRVRTAALHGNVTLLCLKILEASSESAKAKKSEAAAPEPPTTPGHQQLLSQVDDEELTITAIRILQESSLNEIGVLLFESYEGPTHVVERLKTWSTLQEQLQPLMEEGEGRKTDSEGAAVNARRVVDTLKAVYLLLFETCGSANDCSQKWADAGLIEIPRLTLGISDQESLFLTDLSYVGLALGTLRVFSSRGLLPKDQMTQFVDIAIERIVASPRDSWVNENGLALLALVMMRDPDLVEYVDEFDCAMLGSCNVWKLIVQQCEAIQGENHVLYQGFLCLQAGCLANRERIVPRIVDAGASHLIDSILPIKENVYIENLITAAIKLKHLISPRDFEREELQNYIRSPKYQNLRPQAVEPLQPVFTEAEDLRVTEKLPGDEGSGMYSQLLAGVQKKETDLEDSQPLGLTTSKIPDELPPTEDFSKTEEAPVAEDIPTEPVRFMSPTGHGSELLLPEDISAEDIALWKELPLADQCTADYPFM